VLVSHEITKRGWKDVREGELCKIPGVGPISAQRAKEIARDAFLSGLFYDGTDLRHFRRWTRNTPVGVLTALQLGEPPEYGSAEVGVGILMTGSSASVASAAFATRRTIARLMSPGAPRRPPISSGAAMAAIRTRPQRIARKESSHFRTRMPGGDRRTGEGRAQRERYVIHRQRRCGESGPGS
jgi:hypothetical protein